MVKKFVPLVIGLFLVAIAAGCGDDGGADPVIELNDPNSSRQPTAVAGAGGGGAPAPSTSDSSAAPSTSDK